MKRLSPISVASASVLAGGGPVAASSLASEFDRHGVICGPRAPHPDDNHADYAIVATGTGSNVLMSIGTGTATGAPPNPTPDEADAMDAIVLPLLYPEFIGVQPRIVTTGTQEAPGLW